MPHILPPSLINHTHVLQTPTLEHPKYTSQTAPTAVLFLPLKTQSTSKQVKVSIRGQPQVRTASTQLRAQVSDGHCWPT